ncbi:hypothetical protein [Thermocatellispora tengchongensis]|uniref:hypothetical protein n=1 Tax=Thermocatellispora tengchongensis TaxID=1073253 RepID=UPI00362EE461
MSSPSTSMRSASDTPYSGIQPAAHTTGRPSITPGAATAAHTVTAAGTSASHQNPRTPQRRTTHGPATAATA